MPPSVDHATRRADVAKIALAVVAAEGAEALTIRRVAQAAGYSTAIVSHYFANKRDLLIFTYRFAHQRSMRRAEAALADTGDLQPFFDALLPLDTERAADWRLWFSFWGGAVSDAEFAAVQRQAGRDSREMIERALMSARTPVRINSKSTAEMASRRLVTVVVGVATQAVFDLEDWPPERQSAIIADELAAYRFQLMDHAG